MNASIIVTIFNGIIILLLILMLIYTVRAFLGRASWGQVRYMGGTAAIFLWIEIVFYLVVFESAFSIVSFIIDLPLWVDLLVLLIIIILISSIFIKASHRDKFKKKLFIALILVPLGIPGVQSIGKLFKIGSIEIVEKEAIHLVKESQLVGKNTLKNDIVLLPKYTDKGEYAEKLTEEMLKIENYTILPSKASGNTGIDHIAVKFSKNSNNKIKIDEVRIIETKSNTSQLVKNQMSKAWISNHLENLFLKYKDNKEFGQLYFLILKEWNKKSPKITTELWKHKLDENILKTSKISPESTAKIINTSEPERRISEIYSKINCQIKNSCI